MPSLEADNGAWPLPLLAWGAFGVVLAGGVRRAVAEAGFQPPACPLWRQEPGYSSRSSRLAFFSSPGRAGRRKRGGRYRTRTYDLRDVNATL